MHPNPAPSHCIAQSVNSSESIFALDEISKMTDSVIDLTHDDSETEELDISAEYKNIVDSLGSHRNSETKYLMKERKWFNRAEEEENPAKRQKYMKKAMKYSMKATHHRVESEELMDEVDFKLNEDIPPEDELLWAK